MNLVPYYNKETRSLTSCGVLMAQDYGVEGTCICNCGGVTYTVTCYSGSMFACPICLGDVVVTPGECPFCGQYPCVCGGSVDPCDPSSPYYDECICTGYNCYLGPCDPASPYYNDCTCMGINCGGGDPGGGGDDVGDEDDNNQQTDTPNTDPIYNSSSSLSPDQKVLLEFAMANFKNNNLIFDIIYNYFVGNGITLRFEMKSDLTDPAAYSNGTIYFKNDSYISLEFLQEEMIHAYQNQIYATEFNPMLRNIELEAKMLEDLITLETDYIGVFYGTQGFSQEDGNLYSDWLMQIIDVGYIDKATYDSFGEIFDYPPPGGYYDPNFWPYVLDEFFNIY